MSDVIIALDPELLKEWKSILAHLDIDLQYANARRHHLVERINALSFLIEAHKKDHPEEWL